MARVAYSLLDSKLSLGAETNVELVDTRAARFVFQPTLVLGWRL